VLLFLYRVKYYDNTRTGSNSRLSFGNTNTNTNNGGGGSGYGAPSGGYGAPSSGYGAPASSYDAPSSGYGAPSTGYGGGGGSSYDSPVYVQTTAAGGLGGLLGRPLHSSSSLLVLG
jgi:hypothetical protein